MTWLEWDRERLCRWLFTILQAQRTSLLSTNGIIGLALALCIQSVTRGKLNIILEQVVWIFAFIFREYEYLENNTNNNYIAVQKEMKR